MNETKELKSFDIDLSLFNPYSSQQNRFKNLSLLEVTKLCFYLGLITFGGPISHIGIFKKLLIEEKNFLSENDFTDLFNLCNVVPGPSSSQLLTAIMTIKTKSVLAALISFLCFNMPALIFMILIAHFLKSSFNLEDFKHLNPESSSFSYVVYLFFMGICQAAVANIFQAAITLSEKIKNNFLQIGLLVLAAIIFLLTGDHYSMIIIMISCGIITVLRQDNSILLNKIYDNNSKDNQEIPWFLGFPSLITWCLIALFFIIGNYFEISNTNFILAKSFFRIGSIIVGGDM